MNVQMPDPSELQMLREGMLPMIRRPRRNRSSETWRGLVSETHLHATQLVLPVFVTEGPLTPIASMPGIFRLPIDDLLEEIEEALTLGIKSINLFCQVAEHKKDAIGTEAYRKDNVLIHAIHKIKITFPEVLVIADVALDPFTDHGLDGIVNEKSYVVNDPTLIALGHMSLRVAEAGVDLISPSDMMDGRVAYLRNLLDANGFCTVGILSYAVKFASSLYAPFREALGSGPKKGDKKTFQVNPANGRDAILECLLDDQQGADMLLIKPAITSLDIIASVRSRTLLPLGAYQVSGEYAMIKAASHNAWLNGEAVLMESLISIRRAGADFIFTYAAKEAAHLLKS